MENFNLLVAELMVKDAVRLHSTPQRNQPLPPDRPGAHVGAIKRALASTLVRLGLRLDPAVGEGLGAFDFTLARPQRTPHA